MSSTETSSGSLFNSEPLQCDGGGDFGLHKDLAADSPVFDLPAPNLRFLSIANGGDHKTRTFHSGPKSVTHWNVAGLHTFTGERSVTVRLRWFPKTKLAAERNKLHAVRCPPDLACEDDHWGQ